MLLSDGLLMLYYLYEYKCICVCPTHDRIFIIIVRKHALHKEHYTLIVIVHDYTLLVYECTTSIYVRPGTSTVAGLLKIT